MAGAAQITEADLKEYAATAGPELRRQYPKLYGFLGGLMGTAPDQFEGSVLDPNTAKVRAGAEYGFPMGSAAQVLPFGAGIAGGKSVASGGRAAQSGVLRLGGREDLIASHHTALGRLLNAEGELLPELSNLSLAITKDSLPQILGGNSNTTVVLVPRAGKFDPRTSPSVVHSRDAWTPHYADSITNALLRSNPEASTNMLAQARSADRYQTRWPAGGAGAEVASDAVLGNTRFNSFRGFENSPQGADLLGTSQQSATMQARVPALINSLEADASNMGMAPGEFLRELMQSSEPLYRGLDKRMVYQAIRTGKRPYAEIKNFGPTQLTGDTFAGALIRPDNAKMSAADSMQRMAVVQQLTARGIPVVPRSLSAEANFQRATNLQKQAR